jgi:hypothetical protein
VAIVAHALTFGSHFRQWISPSSVRVGLRVDHGAPGAHLIWEVENTGNAPITLTKLVVHGAGGRDTTLVLELPHVLAPKESFVLPTDVDWGLLAAESVAFVDVDGCEYPAPRRAFADARDQLRAGVDRRSTSLSARDFLFGAAEMAFGIAILGLGFFMLMYAIATG